MAGPTGERVECTAFGVSDRTRTADEFGSRAACTAAGGLRRVRRPGRTVKEYCVRARRCGISRSPHGECACANSDARRTTCLTGSASVHPAVRFERYGNSDTPRCATCARREPIDLRSQCARRCLRIGSGVRRGGFRALLVVIRIVRRHALEPAMDPQILIGDRLHLGFDQAMKLRSIRGR